MGRLHDIKRFDILIHLVPVKENNNSKLLIQVDDGSKIKLQRLIDRLRLSNSVFLIGLINFIKKRIINKLFCFFLFVQNLKVLELLC